MQESSPVGSFDGQISSGGVSEPVLSDSNPSTTVDTTAVESEVVELLVSPEGASILGEVEDDGMEAISQAAVQLVLRRKPGLNMNAVKQVVATFLVQTRVHIDELIKSASML